MELGVFSRTYPLTGTDELFAHIARDGFQAVQFNFSSAGLASLPVDLPPEILDGVRAGASRHGLTLCALSGTYNMAHPDARKRHADRIGFANVVRAASYLRVSLVTLCTGTRDRSDMWAAHPDNTSGEAWSTLREELDFALELADREGVVLGVEPEPGNVARDAKSARRLLDEVGSSRLKIVLDAANLLPPDEQRRQREVFEEAVTLLGEHLALVHTKDVGPAGEPVAAGKGVVDFRTFLATILSTSYRGPMVSHNFPAKEAPAVSNYLKHLLAELQP
jgi:sugar phosphate isomerase/epimerase